MSLSRLGLSLGIGGGAAATSSGAPLAVAGGFNISIRDTEANILARTGDAVGTIAFGTDTTEFYVYDGANWEIYSFQVLYSLDFDGANDYMVASGTELDLESNFSTSAWVKVEGDLGLGFAWAWGQYTWGKRRSLLVNGGVWEFNFYGDEASGRAVPGTTTVALNTWYHVATTVNSDYSEGKIYVDGTLENTVNLTGALAHTYSSTYVGSQGVGQSPMNAKIDEMAIFSGVLSASDVTSIYNGGTPANLGSFSPVGWWRMGENDGLAGTTITDRGSGGNDGTLANGPTFSTDVP